MYILYAHKVAATTVTAAVVLIVEKILPPSPSDTHRRYTLTETIVVIFCSPVTPPLLKLYLLA